MDANPFSYYRHLKNAETYVNENLSRSIRATDVADAIGLSPTYFSAFFREKTGYRFGDWLRRRRVDEAKKILASSDAPLYRVASDVGFGSISAFERAFKKHTGMTPRKYRKHVAPR